MQEEGSSMGLRARGASMTPRRILVALGVAASVVALSACGSDDGDGGNTGERASADIGKPITKPVELKPFKPGPAGAKPDLPKRLAWAMHTDVEFAQAMTVGLKAAAEDNGVEFISANAGGDSAKNVQQIQQFMAQGIGALAMAPVDPAAQAPLMKEAIDKGIAVLNIGHPPATHQVNADQYAVGRALGEDAARYITTELGGKADVVILNQDKVEPVRPRFAAIRDALKKVPGATIVADTEPTPGDKDGAFKTMNTILQKHPDVDVVLGADAVVLGALAALEAANKDTPRQYVGGVDGVPEALANIRKGGPYKATVALAPAMFAYAMGQAGADWLEGKQIPQAVDIKPILLTSAEEIDAYEADELDPSAAYQDPARREKYLRLLGNISYETRGNYLDYQWAP